MRYVSQQMATDVKMQEDARGARTNPDENAGTASIEGCGHSRRRI
jgi:hypothetical protein